MDNSEFIVSVKFDDGTVVEIGPGDEFYVTPEDGSEAALLTDARVDLIRRLRTAEVAE